MRAANAKWYPAICGQPVTCSLGEKHTCQKTKENGATGCWRHAARCQYVMDLDRAGNVACERILYDGKCPAGHKG